jgi:hypothetical protein
LQATGQTEIDRFPGFSEWRIEIAKKNSRYFRQTLKADASKGSFNRNADPSRI